MGVKNECRGTSMLRVFMMSLLDNNTVIWDEIASQDRRLGRCSQATRSSAFHSLLNVRQVYRGTDMYGCSCRDFSFGHSACTEMLVRCLCTWGLMIFCSGQWHLMQHQAGWHINQYPTFRPSCNKMWNCTPHVYGFLCLFVPWSKYSLMQENQLESS